MKIIKNCKICNKEFKSYKSQNRKFCSKECRLRFMSILLSGKIKVARLIKKCKFCKKEFIVPRYMMNKIYCSLECKIKNMDSSHLLKYAFKKGHPSWNKGKTNSNKKIKRELYPSNFTKELKEKIIQRDECQCVLCGFSRNDHKLKYHCDLHVHHIDYNKQNCNENNLITTCIRHNTKANHNSKRKWWYVFKTIANLQKGILD